MNIGPMQKYKLGFTWFWLKRRPEMGSNELQILRYSTWVDFSWICTLLHYLFTTTFTFTPYILTQIYVLSTDLFMTSSAGDFHLLIGCSFFYLIKKLNS